MSIVQIRKGSSHWTKSSSLTSKENAETQSRLSDAWVIFFISFPIVLLPQSVWHLLYCGPWKHIFMELSLWDIEALSPPYYICQVTNLCGLEHAGIDRKKLCLFNLHITLSFTHKDKILAASFCTSHSVQIYRESQKHPKRTAKCIIYHERTWSMIKRAHW